MRPGRRLLLLLLCLPLCSSGREYPFLHYNQESGLPGNKVYSIFQDSDDCLWFATDKGIARYNGLKFEHFTTNDGLPDNDVFSFCKDPDGRLWLATYNGQLGFYKNGIFHNEKNTPWLRRSNKYHAIPLLAMRSDGTLLLTASNQYPRSVLVLQHDSLKEVIFKEKHFSAAAGNIYWKGDEIVMEDGGAILYFDLNGILLRRESRNLGRIDAGLPYYAFMKRFNSNVIFGRDLYDEQGRIVWQLPDRFSVVNRMNKLYRTKDHFFAATIYGLWVDSILLLENTKVSNVIQDRQGNYWVSTLNKGVYKFPQHFLSARRYSNVYASVVSNVNAVPGGFVFGTDELNLFRVTDTGVHCFSRYREVYQRPGKNTEYVLLPFDLKRLYVLLLGGNYQVREGREQLPDPLPSLHPEGGLKHVLWKNKDLYLHMMTRIHVTRPEALFDPGLYDKTVPGSDTGRRIYQMRMAPDSSVWYTDLEHVYKISAGRAEQQKQFGSFTFREMIFCKEFLVGIDPSNHLVVARNYNSAQIEIDSSLPNNCVWDKCYPLTDSSILISTNDYYRIISFGNGSGAYRLEILEYPFIPQLAEKFYSDGRNGYFFKNGNLTSIPLKDLVQLPALPRLSFSYIRAGLHKIPADTLVELSHNASRDLSLYYTVQSFNTMDISFEYQISNTGQTGQWISSNGANIDLFNIAAGEYTISIRARTFGGRYSQVQTLQLHIGLPFWLSWWFLGAMALTGSALLFLFIRFYTRRRLAQKEKENKFLRSEFTALNALMNPHFVFNSLNSVQSLINKEDLEAANQYVRTISDLLRQNMHNISRELIPLKREMALILNYMKLEKLRFKERLQYGINIAEDVEEDFVMVPPLLVQPLVENAIKYTLAFSEISAGKISIDIYTSEEKVFIDVTDNGRGLNASKAQKTPGHESTALGNIKSRLEQLSQIHGKQYQLEIIELKTDTGDIAGTRARVSIEL